ncbi:PREDICTED: protein SHI RELATED SEQUENCE 7-like [Lupinus angustifolius]|uniref:protein SHI RELATED SEQUENCE 7-like n=1 Tax=Lupinus angustifolius TaxID=3871 RepID=UPI00092E96D0|nr:PREDICTED: protein SHI RELATED SEQUENCE 7-like [Lupinus angustifolius]
MSGLEEFKFPPSMSSMAVFSCVRVQSMDDTVNEIAYQTSINIEGHVFSGLLYDQGPDQQSFNDARGQRSSNSLHQQHNNLNLVSAEIQDGATMAQPSSAAATAYHHPFFPPSNVFPSSISFRPGMP